MSKIKIYDTTLRDGMQGEKISFTLEEKLEITKKLDDIGIHYIEGGFPLSNQKEEEFFKQVKNIKLKQAIICAFGSTRKPGGKAETDGHILALLNSETPAVTIVGKSWDRHVKEVIRTTEDENLKMIYDSIYYLKKQNREVIFDAEHFFDGFQDNPDYAIKTLKAAKDAGVDWLVLADTNGGTIHTKLIEAIDRSVKEVPGNYGIHIHNDIGLAVANSLISVDHGITQIQGTLNGWGERCGNANLCTIIPNLYFKMGYTDIMTKEQIKELTSLSRYASEVANIIPNERSPYVGRSAFAHKAGQHADVIVKNPELMEHMPGVNVGNERRILLSELAGKSTIALKLKKYGDFDKKSPEVEKITNKLKEMENLGYEYEAAEASFDLLVRKELGLYKSMFELLNYSVEIFKTGNEDVKTLVRMKLLENKRELMGAAVQTGPVGALDKAIRESLKGTYPFIENIKLIDFKVRVLNADKATSAKVRVFITSTDNHKTWTTVGVSENILEASWQALVDSLDYYANEIIKN